MSEQLKPCPFCAGAEIVVVHETPGAEVYCDSCFAEIKVLRKGRLAQNIDAKWNTRPREDVLQAKVDALEALIKKADAVILWVKDGVHSGNAVRFVHTVDNYETARAKLNEVKRHE